MNDAEFGALLEALQVVIVGTPATLGAALCELDETWTGSLTPERATYDACHSPTWQQCLFCPWQMCYRPIQGA